MFLAAVLVVVGGIRIFVVAFVVAVPLDGGKFVGGVLVARSGGRRSLLSQDPLLDAGRGAREIGHVERLRTYWK